MATTQPNKGPNPAPRPRTQQMSTPFPPGFMDGLLHQLPLSARLHFFLNWSRLFSTEKGRRHYGPSLYELFKSITKLDFGYYRNITTDQAKFFQIGYLPLPSITHLDLSFSTIGDNPNFLKLLTYPIFRNLEVLNLGTSDLQSIAHLLDSPHPFPKLHTLDLSYNESLSAAGIGPNSQT